MRCIVCGRREGAIDYQCLPCFLEKHEVLKKIPERLRVYQCRSCGVFFYGAFQEGKLRDLLGTVLSREITYDKKLLYLDRITRDFDREVFGGRLHGTINGNKVAIPYQFPLEVKESLCKECAKLSSQYFEGTMQLRGTVQTIEELRRVARFIVGYCEQVGVRITKIEPAKNGEDYYLPDGKLVKELAYAVKKKFGGEVKTNARLFSKDRQTSKEIYRVTALVRLPDFSPHDLMVTDRMVLRIDRIQGHRALGTNLSLWKPGVIEYQQEAYTIVRHGDITNTRISKISPRLEALDPLDYQSKPVANPPPERLALDQNVRVAKVKGRLYLVKY